MVFVCTGYHVGLARFVQASTTTTEPFVEVKLNPKPLVPEPTVKTPVWTDGFHNTEGKPAKKAPQPVVPGK